MLTLYIIIHYTQYTHTLYIIITHTYTLIDTGNWSPSDFPEGDSFRPHSETNQSVNRDMLVVMKSPGITDKFNQVFSEDWMIGTPWQPK